MSADGVPSKAVTADVQKGLPRGSAGVPTSDGDDLFEGEPCGLADAVAGAFRGHGLLGDQRVA